MPAQLKCVVCGKLFLVPPCRAKTAYACSNECSYKVRGLSMQRRVTLACRHCGKLFEVPFCHRNKRTHCSMECRDADQERKKWQQAAVTGDRNPMWSGGTAVHSDGYVYRAVPDHPYQSHGSAYVLEHRLVMEDVMRRCVPDHPFLVAVEGKLYLRREVTVHHIDCDKRNNAFENLLVLKGNGTHRALHNGSKLKPGTYWPEPPNGVFLRESREASTP